MLQFGTSGLRGLVKDMTDKECYINTRGFIKYLIHTNQIKEKDIIAVAGDLRTSTPRIMKAIGRAIKDAGMQVENCGAIPTPALAYYAMMNNRASIMVTGSHIPDDRNGIKFYKPKGEVMKNDEDEILAAVTGEREKESAREKSAGLFDDHDMFRGEVSAELPEVNRAAEIEYIKRYQEIFPENLLQGKKVVVDQHSAVGRDLLVVILEGFGAEVIPEGRSDKFISKDTENITSSVKEEYHRLAEKYQPLAIVSTDGDSDRPLVVDEEGVFYRGDILGAAAAHYLDARYAAIPISTNDAVIEYLKKTGVELTSTRIGSPYVIMAMNQALAAKKDKVVGWEVNGGFMTGSEFSYKGKSLKALPTRDAVLPILCALFAAVEAGSISRLFKPILTRYTQAGLIDDFPVATCKELISALRPEDKNIIEVDFEERKIVVLNETDGRKILDLLDGHEIEDDIKRFWKKASSNGVWLIKNMLENKYFTSLWGFGLITRINWIDGIRITFDNGDIVHIRPSGNAPQLRIYSNADTQKRADEIIARSLDQYGILRLMERNVNTQQQSL